MFYFVDTLAQLHHLCSYGSSVSLATLEQPVCQSRCLAVSLAQPAQVYVKPVKFSVAKNGLGGRLGARRKPRVDDFPSSAKLGGPGQHRSTTVKSRSKPPRRQNRYRLLLIPSRFRPPKPYATTEPFARPPALHCFRSTPCAAQRRRLPALAIAACRVGVAEEEAAEFVQKFDLEDKVKHFMLIYMRLKIECAVIDNSRVDVPMDAKYGSVPLDMLEEEAAEFVQKSDLEDKVKQFMLIYMRLKIECAVIDNSRVDVPMDAKYGTVPLDMGGFSGVGRTGNKPRYWPRPPHLPYGVSLWRSNIIPTSTATKATVAGGSEEESGRKTGRRREEESRKRLYSLALFGGETSAVAVSEEEEITRRKDGRWTENARKRGTRRRYERSKKVAGVQQRCDKELRRSPRKGQMERRGGTDPGPAARRRKELGRKLSPE
ncbi:hypothetical protein LXL04_028659 [Taraxacum kok-saghyz]